MAAKILRAGYYWPTVQGDCTKFVQKWVKCQDYGNLTHQKSRNLHYILSPWPFVKWEMDIIGPFALGKEQCKFLLVGIDYFTKWIKVEPFVAITAQTSKFFSGETLCADLEYHILSSLTMIDNLPIEDWLSFMKSLTSNTSQAQ